MKKIITLFIALFLTANLFAQTEDESSAIAYIDGSYLSFYDLTTGENYRFVRYLGSLPTKLYFDNHNLYVVCSGNFSEGDTKLIIINEYAFSSYQATLDTNVFYQNSITVPLEQFGNAWDVVSVNDTTVLVTLAASSKFQLVNRVSGQIVATISDNIDGNPQGVCDLNDEYVAVALADWGFGTPGNSVAIVSKATGEVTETIELRTNVVDVKKLSNGNLLAVTWGTWFGEDNYGTVSLINSDSLNVMKTWYPADSAKAYKTVELDERYVHLNAYTRDFLTVTSVLDMQNLTDSTITEGFWAKHIIAKVNNILLAQDSLGVELYSPEGDSLGLIQYIYPTDVAGIFCPPIGVEDENITVSNFSLSQNYPNPFNPSTTIEYTIPQTESGLLDVSLKVYDILGREITSLVNAKQTAGNYTVRFNAENLPSGIYFYTLKAGNFSTTKKMILMK